MSLDWLFTDDGSLRTMDSGVKSRSQFVVECIIVVLPSVFEMDRYAKLMIRGYLL